MYPDAQGRQEGALSEEYVPARQLEHAEEEVAAVIAELFPLGHAVHLVVDRVSA